jgi:hypothetical protein
MGSQPIRCQMVNILQEDGPLADRILQEKITNHKLIPRRNVRIMLISPSHTRNCRIPQHQDVAPHHVLQQQMSIRAFIASQRADMAKHKIRRYPTKLLHNKAGLLRHLHIRSHLWPYGQILIMGTTQPYATTQLRMQHIIKESSENSNNKGYHNRPTQLLPREDVALVVWGNKVTRDISGPLRFHASKAVAQTYLQQRKKNNWTSKLFEEVDWEHLYLALKNKADM